MHNKNTMCAAYAYNFNYRGGKGVFVMQSQRSYSDFTNHEDDINFMSAISLNTRDNMAVC